MELSKIESIRDDAFHFFTGPSTIKPSVTVNVQGKRNMLNLNSVSLIMPGRKQRLRSRCLTETLY